MNDQNVKDDTKRFILMMLGYPVLEIELDNMHLDLCVNRVFGIMSTSTRVSKWSANYQLIVAQNGALALAKIILGRIRTKYAGLLMDSKGVNTNMSEPGGAALPCPTDGHILLEEGNREYLSWQLKVFGEEFPPNTCI